MTKKNLKIAKRKEFDLWMFQYQNKQGWFNEKIKPILIDIFGTIELDTVIFNRNTMKYEIRSPKHLAESVS